MSEPRYTASTITDDQLDALYRRAETAEAVVAAAKKLLQRRTTTLRERAERAEATIERVRTGVAGIAHTTSAGISDYDIGRHDMACTVLATLDQAKESTTP
jgi:hypothetical protein